MNVGEETFDDRDISWRFFGSFDKTKRVLIIQDYFDSKIYILAKYVKSLYVIDMNGKQYEININENKVNKIIYNKNLKEINFDNIIYQKDINLKINKKNILNKIENHNEKVEKLLILRNPLIKDSSDKLLIKIMINPHVILNIKYAHKIISEVFKKNNEIKMIYFYKGSVGEAYCIYGNGENSYNYYNNNFISYNKFRLTKKYAYKVISILKIYKYMAYNFIYIIKRGNS
ncbi:MAG: hypothetical protein SCH71_15510 [Desulfobulbaceae bacterium]|nr:hypothetical protein [Desulfobulbaceae bacterium]